MNNIMITALAVVATTLAVTHGVKVCFPDVWEGHVDQKSIEFDQGKPHYQKIDNSMSYDLTNRRRTMMLSVADNGVVKKYHQVVRFEGAVDNGTVYTVDLQLGKCFIKPTRSPFYDACLPPDTQFVGNFHLGVGKSTLPVIDYRASINGVPTIFTVTPVDDEHVVPVLGGGSKATNNGYLKGFIYFDFTLGIKDPSVFDIPKPCLKGSSSDIHIPNEILKRFSLM